MTPEQKTTYQFSVIQHHNVVVRQIILTEVGTFFRYGKVTFFVRATEQSCETEILRILIVIIKLSAESEPEKVLRFFSFIDDLK